MGLIPRRLRKQCTIWSGIFQSKPCQSIQSARVQLGQHGGKRLKGKGEKQVAIGNLPTPKGGNVPAYAMARLQRDHPKLAAQVVAGKISANSAAIKAGFLVKDGQSARLDDVRKAVDVLLKHFTREELLSVLQTKSKGEQE